MQMLQKITAVGAALHIRVIHEIISTRCACRSSWRELLVWSSLLEKKQKKISSLKLQNLMLSTKIPKHTCSFGRSVSTAAVDC